MNLEFIDKLNNYGSLKEPFFFLVSYDLNDFVVEPLKNLPQDIKFEINLKNNSKSKKVKLKKYPISFESYKEKFDLIKKEIIQGNSYLLNLTAPTKIETDLSLDEIYIRANAEFKLKYKDEFVCFSPERFVKIKNNKIFTYPMKGTINANIPNARKIILEDKKEFAEHIMVTDLLRNDLGIVANNIEVDKFRYIDEITTNDNKLLQVSSQISGILEENWCNKIGDIFSKLLPAGSITGTPKKNTVEILNKIEDYQRGYYTGVCGIFDGVNLDSYVMIRFIQKNENGDLIYKSGGGITNDSNAKTEYEELIDKVYLPF